MSGEPSHLPIAAEFETPQAAKSSSKNDIMESLEQQAQATRLDENTSPGTAVEHDDDDSDDSVPPVPPVPQNLSRKASRVRARRSYPKDYSSDPQMYGQQPGRQKQPRFLDEWYETDANYASDRAWREEVRHPDYYDRRYTNRAPPRAGPPRTFLNNRSSMQFEQNKHWVDDAPRTPATYVDPFSPRHPPSRSWYPDEEMGYGPGPGQGYNGAEDKRIQWESLTKEQKAEVMRLPWLQWMHSDVKNHFVASLGEFVGTTMFLFFAFAATEVANIQSRANNSGSSSDSNTTTGGATGFNVGVQLYIALAFGFSLMVNVWVCAF